MVGNQSLPSLPRHPGRITVTPTLARHHAVRGAVSNGRDRGNPTAGKIVELLFANVKDALAATQPQVLLAIFQNSINEVIKQAIAGGVNECLVFANWT